MTPALPYDTITPTEPAEIWWSADRGIETPLLPAYEAQILAQSNAADLLDAWKRARTQG